MNVRVSEVQIKQKWLFLFGGRKQKTLSTTPFFHNHCQRNEYLPRFVRVTWTKWQKHRELVTLFLDTCLPNTGLGSVFCSHEECQEYCKNHSHSFTCQQFSTTHYIGSLQDSKFDHWGYLGSHCAIFWGALSTKNHGFPCISFLERPHDLQLLYFLPAKTNPELPVRAGFSKGLTCFDCFVCIFSCVYLFDDWLFLCILLFCTNWFSKVYITLVLSAIHAEALQPCERGASIQCYHGFVEINSPWTCRVGRVFNDLWLHCASLASKFAFLKLSEPLLRFLQVSSPSIDDRILTRVIQHWLGDHGPWPNQATTNFEAGSFQPSWHKHA